MNIRSDYGSIEAALDSSARSKAFLDATTKSLKSDKLLAFEEAGIAVAFIAGVLLQEKLH